MTSFINVSRKCVVCLFFTTLVVPALLVGCTLAPSGGTNTKEQLIRSYLEALENGDRGALESLVPETHSAEREIDTRITSFAGGQFRDISTNFSGGDINPSYKTARVDGTYIDSQGVSHQYRETLDLQRIQGKWYLILGRHREGLPESVSPISSPPSN